MHGKKDKICGISEAKEAGLKVPTQKKAK